MIFEQMGLHCRRQAEIIHPCAVVAAHDDAELGGTGIFLTHHFVLFAVGVGYGVPVDIQHKGQGGVFLQIGGGTVIAFVIGAVVVRVVDLPVMEDRNAV